MDTSDPPRNWPASLLILLFDWNVGRKSGEFSPKHCEVEQIGQDDSDDSFPAEMGQHVHQVPMPNAGDDHNRRGRELG